MARYMEREGEWRLIEKKDDLFSKGGENGKEGAII